MNQYAGTHGQEEPPAMILAARLHGFTLSSYLWLGRLLQLLTSTPEACGHKNTPFSKEKVKLKSYTSGHLR